MRFVQQLDTLAARSDGNILGSETAEKEKL